MSADLNIKSSELRTTRELMHEMRSIVQQLQHGEVEKIVVTKSGHPVSVMISVEKAAYYQQLEENAT